MLALVAHDNMKRDLAEWVDWNWEILLRHHLVCTGTTGKMVTRTLTERGGAEEISHFDITLLKSGPLGGDQQLGSLIADGKIILGRVHVRKGATVGVYAVAMGSIDIGENAKLVGGATLLPGSKIPAGEVWRGSPARKWISPAAATPKPES